ncbi:hypothetical protein BN159_0970 [Streptomyces davaonensis JCM 4913]|uniref:Integral membrane protein n=1 Tax=Streptomyces davaonensis (strain DSM 101723 / JCM 4913 / KCC S-0913 / 768) TaxID=1214101 RepID=K4QYB0_STRDJ|nr:DUF6629 family protein [Streptomyces davaonensis]CCK25349.1 hypothetical protein BN159_0970 [Streptomyces davaonensis JCM 4913]
MCWSAEADLVAGAGIAAIGVACVAQARRARDLPLAALPLLLGAHQLIEAAVWAQDGGTGPAVLAWAVIALPLLPFWVPVGVFAAAPRRARPRLVVPLTVGIATTAVLSYVLATRAVRAEIRGHTVGYAVDLPHAELVIAGYLIATIGSVLLSGERGLVMFGVLVAVGALICTALWRTEFVSTWCAFAAVASVVLLGWVRGGGSRTVAA